MRPFLRPLSLSLAVFLLTSCAGYRLEGRRPGPLKSIETLALPLAENRTLFPRAEALTTNTVADVLLQDGTYRLSPLEGADATLQLVLSEIQYDQARSSRFDTIRSEELSMTVTLQWHITDPMKPGSPLFSGSSSGSTRFFAGGNLQTARSGALPDALKRAAEKLVARISNGL